jgi:hypothetical protein
MGEVLVIGCLIDVTTLSESVIRLGRFLSDADEIPKANIMIV